MGKLYLRRGEGVLFNIILQSVELESSLCPQFREAVLAWVIGGPSTTLLRRDMSQQIPSMSLILPLINTITGNRKQPKAQIRNSAQWAGHSVELFLTEKEQF